MVIVVCSIVSGEHIILSVVVFIVSAYYPQFLPFQQKILIVSWWKSGKHHCETGVQT